MDEAIIRSVPRPSYWLAGILVYPLASFVFTAIIVRPLCLLLGVKDSGRLILLSWFAVTVLVAAWAYHRDYRRLCYVLFPDALVLGRGASAVVIPFVEIRSIVLALPERMSWLLRIQRFNPKGRSLYRNAVQARRSTILLRLSGQRYLPLNTAYTS